VTPEEAAAVDDRFTEAYSRCASAVYRYALRHAGAIGADDVVSETFMVAWRRRSELPQDPLPWLIAVARRTLQNQRRGEIRRARLAGAVGHWEQAVTSTVIHGPDAADMISEREVTVAALRQLTDIEREALLLVAWDGLTAAAAAVVAGCTTRAFEVRLSRARAHLARELDARDRSDAGTHC
jgi:RNA polymerase sigma factor (sigma-70 family)